MVDVYEAKLGQSMSSALFLPGFPASMNANPVTRLLTSLGYCVFFPQYPGTYDSSGEYTPKSALSVAETIQSRISQTDEITNLKDNAPVKIPPRIEIVVGYSFGAFVAVRSLPSLPFCKRLITISPAFTYGDCDIDMGFRESGDKFLDYIKRTRPMTYRLGEQQVWSEFYGGGMNIPAKHPKVETLFNLTIFGSKDKSIDGHLLRRNLIPFLSNFASKIESAECIENERGEHSVDTLISDEIREKLSNFSKISQPYS